MDPKILAIPGYAEAVHRERLNRDAAFLNVPLDVAGFDVAPITLRKYLLLKVTGSSFLTGETPTPCDVISFLWLMHPGYVVTIKPFQVKAYQGIVRRSLAFMAPEVPRFKNRFTARSYERKLRNSLIALTKIVIAIRSFVDEQLQDYPAKSGNVRGEAPSYYSNAAYLCGLFGKNFGWTDDYVLDCPMPRILQYLNFIRQANGSNAPLFNPSDKVTGRWLSEQNKATAKAAAN